MEFYQLEDFIAVVEEHGFTRAADRVLRSQAAVSVAIGKLEQEVGVPLMARESHECVLTEAGHVVLSYARRMIELRSELQRTLVDVTSLAAGRLSIAANESATHYLLPAPLAAFHSKFPAIKIESRLCEVDEIAHLVAHREVDLGLGIRQLNLRGLSSEVILVDPLVLVVAPGHRLARQRSVRIVDIGDERFFVHHLGTWTSDAIQRLFENQGVIFNAIAELGNFETVKRFVKTGTGIAVIPQCAARADLETGELVLVDVADLKICRTIEIVYRERSVLLPAPAEFVNTLRGWRWNADHDQSWNALSCAGSSLATGDSEGASEVERADNRMNVVVPGLGADGLAEKSQTRRRYYGER
jgi:DNA-binding transcriptional LysR family regulator